MSVQVRLLLLQTLTEDTVPNLQAGPHKISHTGETTEGTFMQVFGLKAYHTRIEVEVNEIGNLTGRTFPVSPCIVNTTRLSPWESEHITPRQLPLLEYPPS